MKKKGKKWKYFLFLTILLLALSYNEANETKKSINATVYGFFEYDPLCQWSVTDKILTSILEPNYYKFTTKLYFLNCHGLFIVQYKLEPESLAINNTQLERDGVPYIGIQFFNVNDTSHLTLEAKFKILEINDISRKIW